jgi:glutamyl-tRNA synthetase
MNNIITRFAPSPSGYLHVGGARTAIFNWLYARHMKGKFILRIENTDAARSSQESIEAIFDALRWLGIDWDGDPYFQSQRMAVYEEYSQKLIDSGQAYYCTCSPERLQQMREKAIAAGGKPKYDGTCRERALPSSEKAVLRFKAPWTGTTIVDDVVKGTIVFQNKELDDFILVRSDQKPTYNFVVVVDDISMGINTIIRGDDHVMNTPKQILIYNALQKPLPVFGHVPMVLGKDKARLSKRHGATSVTAYRDMGYLPDAVINYLVRLGWSHGDQEFFTRDDLVAKFNLKAIGKSAGVFDADKLLALNADHIKATSIDALATQVLPFLKNQGVECEPDSFLKNAIETLTVRSKTLAEMAEGARFYFEQDLVYEEKAAKKFLKAAALKPLKLLLEKLAGLTDFNQTAVEDLFKTVMDQTGLKLGKIAQPVRVALTGKTVSPGIFEIIAVLGKNETSARIKQAVAFIENTQVAD